MPRACLGAGAAAAALVLQLARWIHRGPLYGCPPEVPLPQAETDAWDGQVHVLMASDSQQLRGMLVAMLSLSRNLADPGGCTLHLVVGREDADLVDGMLSCFRGELADLERAAPRVQLHDVTWPPFNITRFPLFMTRSQEEDTLWGYRKPWIWSKVYPHRYIPSVPRALWLDNDVVVSADVSPLFRMPMTRPFAVAVDQEYPHEINTGVLVYNMEAYRAEDVSGAVERWLERWWAEALTPDGRFAHQAFHEQTALSDMYGVQAEAGRRAHFLDWRWNAVGLWNLWRSGSCVHEAHVLHFNGFPLKYWDFWLPSWTIPRWKHALIRRYAPRSCQALNWTFA